MAAVQRPPSSMPEHRRQTPDIIDVDLLDDDVVARPTQRRRLSNARDVITILDSDDDEPVQAGPSRPRAGQSSKSRRSGLTPSV